MNAFTRWAVNPRCAVATAEITTDAGPHIIEITIEGDYSDVIYVRPPCPITPDIESQIYALGIDPRQVAAALPASEIVPRALYPILVERMTIIASSDRDKPIIAELIDKLYCTTCQHYVVNLRPTPEDIAAGRFAEAQSVLRQFNALFDTEDTDAHRLDHTVSVDLIPETQRGEDCLGIASVTIHGALIDRTYGIHHEESCGFDFIRMNDVVERLIEFKIKPVFIQNEGYPAIKRFFAGMLGKDIDNPDELHLCNELHL